MSLSLVAQRAAFAPESKKIRHAILATAMVDALGGPPEFHPRFSFPLVTAMMPNENFSLPPGVWTDDTSMTLCLGRSLATFVPKIAVPNTVKGGFEEKHQLEAYFAWRHKGTLSAIGRCFDIGNTIRQALHIYGQQTRLNQSIDDALQKIDAQLHYEHCAGNGSLMRIIPIGLAYWRDEGLAKQYARRSSRTTHPNLMCQEACEVWTQAVVRIMQSSTSKENEQLTKLDLVKSFASFPYTNQQLREALALPPGVPPPPSSNEDQEKYYRTHYPILKLIAKTQTGTPTVNGQFNKTIPKVGDLPSSGYVLHTLVAALYCFLATEIFEDGAIMAVNLGDDADTVGAVYAGLAGCWYAAEDGKEVDRFWSERVKEWKSKLVERALVETVADELVEFSTSLASQRL